MLRPCSKRFFAHQPQERWRGDYSSLRGHCTRLICSTSKLRRSFAAMLRTARSMSNAAARLLLISPTFLCTDTHTISFCRGSGICGATSRPMTPCTSPSPKLSMLRYSPAINVSPLRPAIMRASSWCEASVRRCRAFRRQTSPCFPTQGIGEAPTVSALKPHPSARRRVRRRGCRASSPHKARRAIPAAKPSPQRRCADNKSARCGFKKIARDKKAKESEATWPCLSHRKDQATIRGTARSRRTAWETRCRY